MGKIDYHASIKFDNDVYNNTTDGQRDTLHREEKNTNKSRETITMEAISALSRKYKEK